jgi:protein-export membrane protein SecD/preprotein translocase SecF subunit
MIDNLGRKITLIVSLVALSVISLVIGGFRLGLDLEGGTRLVYSLDLEAAHNEGLITDAEFANPQALWNDIRKILLDRLDPQGVREPVIRTEGTQRFVIELPGSASALRKSVTLPLAEDITADAKTLLLGATQEECEDFPPRGGQIQLGNETVRYSRRIGNRLDGLERNYGGQGIPEAHSSADGVKLIALDPWREKIENIGSMLFLIEAKNTDLNGSGTDLTTELNAARAWSEANPDSSLDEYNKTLEQRAQDAEQRWKTANPGVDIEEYNKTLRRTEGAIGRLKFYPLIQRDKQGMIIDVPKAQRLQALIVEANEAWRFTGVDVQRVYGSQDTWGLPAVAFEMKPNAKRRFWKFTEEHEQESMAIVINDEIATMPNIDDPLPGSGIIRGEFTTQEVNSLVTVLRSGSLPLKPKFEGQETVTATLGEDYVTRGFMGIGLGLGLVLTFMLAYYRRLGLFAAISLVVNLLLLTGALAFLQATLTLPGVAGILLTIGMAVDANILIYERIREEADRGRKPLQSARDGFGHALSTIVDANLTTLITGLILYKFGTGPVRGFATTLCIGILTSMFSALVVTRVLVHMQLERGIERFKMARLIQQTKVRFMAMAKPAMIGSSVIIIGGVSFFFSLPDEEKLGIDFLGGMTMAVNLADGHTTKEVKTWIGDIEGVIGQSAEVKAVQNTGAGDHKYTRFRITAKGTDLGLEDQGAESKAMGAGNTSQLDDFRNKVTEALSAYLSKGPHEEVTVEGTTASGLLYLERDDHLPADIIAGLADVGVGDATVENRDQLQGNVVHFSGTVSASKTGASLKEDLLERFQAHKDSRGVLMALASPIDEVNAVGAQVVAELRDSAIFAVLLSLFAAIMYIRVRFAEYSFGFAAVVALTHDVLITLGALALADEFVPFIDTEINLPMIAAFLTIIGYSLNDTIVVFDRVRENLPRMKGTLSEIIDTSINQCMARTVLTSVTTLISVTLLLAFNMGTGNVIEGFAFALMIGVVVGTYSSMFIASPVLLWLETRRQAKLGDDDPTKHGVKAEVATT